MLVLFFWLLAHKDEKHLLIQENK